MSEANGNGEIDRRAEREETARQRVRLRREIEALPEQVRELRRENQRLHDCMADLEHSVESIVRQLGDMNHRLFGFAAGDPGLVGAIPERIAEGIERANAKSTRGRLAFWGSIFAAMATGVASVITAHLAGLWR